MCSTAAHKHMRERNILIQFISGTVNVHTGYLQSNIFTDELSQTDK